MTLLESCLRDTDRLAIHVKKIQAYVWEDLAEDSPYFEILCDLAHDLDFFEPNSDGRQEDESYFGAERALDEIRSALTRMKAVQV